MGWGTSSNPVVGVPAAIHKPYIDSGIQCQPREVGVIRSFLIRLGCTPMQQDNLFATIHKN
jgi:hypothetical protein